MAITSQLSADAQALIITIRGRFDFSVLAVFRHAYEQSLIQPKAYVVDLKESDFIDSSALGMLLALREYAQDLGAPLELIHCNPDVKKILNLTKLDELIVVK